MIERREKIFIWLYRFANLELSVYTKEIFFNNSGSDQLCKEEEDDAVYLFDKPTYFQASMNQKH